MKNRNNTPLTKEQLSQISSRLANFAHHKADFTNIQKDGKDLTHSMQACANQIQIEHIKRLVIRGVSITNLALWAQWCFTLNIFSPSIERDVNSIKHDLLYNSLFCLEYYLMHTFLMQVFKKTSHTQSTLHECLAEHTDLCETFNILVDTIDASLKASASRGVDVSELLELKPSKINASVDTSLLGFFLTQKATQPITLEALNTEDNSEAVYTLRP